jgi:hypothetical protein
MWIESERWIGIALVGAGLALSRGASGQSTSLPQGLFDEGRRLLREGDVPAACARFAESQRLEPAGGTLLNLASCHAREGKRATAWAEFHDALAQARRDHREDRVQEARRQIEELELRLPRLTLLVDAPVRAGLEVRLDGVVLVAESWGTALPVDPGEHELSAVAPGYVAWKGRASVGVDGESRVVVPPLAPVAASNPPGARGVAQDWAASATRRPRLAPYVLAGIGLGAAGAGTAFGLVAASKKSASEKECMGAGCTLAGASLLREANTAAWVSNIAFGVGTASLAAAAYLFFLPPASPTVRSSSVGPVVGMHSLGVAAEGTW